MTLLIFLKTLLFIIGTISLIWTIFGLPIAIVVFILYIREKNLETKKGYMKVIKWSLGGFCIWLSTLALFFVLSFFQLFFGLR